MVVAGNPPWGKSPVGDLIPVADVKIILPLPKQV